MQDAKRVLELFADEYVAKGGADWARALDVDQAASMGFTLERYLRLHQVLVQKGLLSKRVGEGFRLTALGERACTDPILLDRVLGIFPTPAVSSSVNIENLNGPAQIGNHNVQHVTMVSHVLASLIEHVERAENVAPEKKAEWTQALRELAAHPLTQTAIQAAATIGAGFTGQQ